MANKEKMAMHVSIVSIIMNLLLSFMKLVIGLIAHSHALVSDAVHSASDVFSTCIVMVGIKIAAKESDSDHPYGHERLECVAAIVLAVVLFITGGGIGVNGIESILDGTYKNSIIPGMVAMVVAFISILVKEWMYHYTKRCAKIIHSDALMADAWHHRSDALSSIGSFVGILGARLGYPITDELASIIICIFILKAAIDIFRDAIDKMVDKSCDKETIDKMRQTIMAETGVLGIDELRTRMFGSQIYVDVEILVDGNKTLWLSHAVAEAVHQRIEKEFPDVKHIMVHVNPYGEA